MWWRETRVPTSRVQHVDIKHGPLERRFGLATLVVHTAAVHLSGITVRGLDDADAQHLRDTLAKQLDDAGDAL
jgi:membrane protein YdbS with pleckstrin-like domain